MTTIARKQQTMNVPAVALLAVLVVIGLAAWFIQLTQGFGVLGVGQTIVWGVYIAAFFLLLGEPELYGLPSRPVNPWRHLAGDYLRGVVGLLAAVAALVAAAGRVLP